MRIDEEERSKSARKEKAADKFKVISEFGVDDPASLIDDNFVDIARLQSGASFGELALIDGKPRIATIKCLSRCHFITMTK